MTDRDTRSTPRPPAPTLDDVARTAGVSTATISRVLNNSGKVSDTTRARVMAAVEHLGYTPNFAAKVMASRRTHTIGAVIPTMESAIFARGIQSFQETLHGLGYTLLVSSTGYRPEVEAEQIRTLIARGADGLLLIGYARDPATYDYLETQSVPTLLSWAYREDSTRPSVGFDNRAAMFELARKVTDMGHRDVAMISGITQGNDRAAQRVEGVRDGLRAAGLDPAKLPIVESPYDIKAGADAFARIMQAPNRPTVVMCGNDVLAVGAIQMAKEMGLRLPQDISITGFDDIELASIVTPQLTTVHVPHRLMGRHAAQELIAIVEGRSPGVSMRLDSKLAMRGSLRSLT